MDLLLGCGLQESSGSDGGGAQGARDEDEEDGGRNGASLWNEGEGEEAETEGLRGRGECGQAVVTIQCLVFIYISSFTNKFFLPRPLSSFYL